MELAYAFDTFYFLVMGAMVMFMGAGFTMLEAGMVRSKNVAEIITKNFALYGIACLMYLLVGYNIMYGGTEGSWIPGFDFLVAGDHAAASPDAYYSKLSDFFFQVVFVATAMSIVSGAVAERMKLWSFLLFAVVMTAVIYPVSGFWKWGGGALNELGFLDFAGSGVVHMAGAAAALAGVLLLGARKGKYGPDGKPRAIQASNLTLVGLGTWILWFGWFGFNGGSQLKMSTFVDANAVAQIFVNTNMAAVGGLLAALLLGKLLTTKSDITMALNGALAGLVAITAEPLTGTAMASTLIGAVGGLICYGSILFLDRVAKIDDPVGAISVHGAAGIWGLLAVPLTNGDATIVAQLIGTGVIFVWVFSTSLITWYVIKRVFGIRVGIKEEHEGSDMEECGLIAYPEFRQSTK
jgi:Amt family ammonium transporter|tara:strand:- start:798 stop:2021 length:1224 start_codon:yes stop_codon:yes gene_type:complete